MKKIAIILTILLSIAVFTLFAGCVSQPATPTSATATPGAAVPVPTTGNSSNTGPILNLTVVSGTTTAAIGSPTIIPSAITSPTTTSSGNATVQVTLTARNFAFNKSTITIPAGSTVVMTFINDDAGVPHNFALYTDNKAATPIFVGTTVIGLQTTTYTFTAPSTPGSAFFRCDHHPELMKGTFITT